jgi:2-dehydropantoate 2-reductase
MKEGDTSVLVIGAGAVGGITAALLKKKGYNVTIVAKYPDYAKNIRESGLSLSGVCGNLLVTMPATASVDEVTEKQDIVLLAVKANDMPEVARQALPLMAEGGYIVSMQNGICEYELASLAGKERVVGCVVGWGATMEAQGELTMTSKGDFIIGYPDRQPDEDLNQIASMLEAVVPVRTTSNIIGHRYSKLIINSCITSMGAVCGLYLGEMLARKRMRKIFVNIIREAVVVAEAMNLKIEVFGGKLDFRKFVEGRGWLADMRRDLTIRVIGFKYRRLKSSSLQSLERGRQTEIDYLNGFIVREAAKQGIPVPVNSKIVEIIKLIEQGKITISIRNFDDRAFD